MGQSVAINPQGGHESISSSEFALKEGAVRVTANQLNISGQTVNQVMDWSSSNRGEKVGVVKIGPEITLQSFDFSGLKISESNLEFFQHGDETIKVYTFDNGEIILRDNVANFSFLNPIGEVLYSVSNSSQSSGGERASMLSSDSNGKTLVLYNPVINYNNGRGSRASLVYNEQKRLEFFRSDNREIRDLRVNKNGSFITLLASGSGNDQAYMFDRFGNELFKIGLDQGQLGISVSDNGQFVTNYSSGRVQVHNVISGERIGSTSSRNPVLYANYIPEDEVIIALNGRLSNGVITDGMITVIHTSKRQIARSDINFTISARDFETMSIERVGAGLFNLKGLNRTLELRTTF